MQTDPIPDEFNQEVVSPNFTGSLTRAFFFFFFLGKRLHAQRLEHASSTHRARAENTFVLLAKIHLCLGKPVHLGMIPFAPAVPRCLTFLPEH